MYEILFYKDKRGREPVKDYIHELEASGGKDARIKLTKIRDYVRALQLYGTAAGEPYMKHLDGDIWELRPIRDRILFAGFADGSFVLLHQFVKKTQKTPAREIERAVHELADFIEKGRGA